MKSANPPLFQFVYRGLRHAFGVLSSRRIDGRDWRRYSLKSYANSLVVDMLESKDPCMISRLGSNELNCLRNYLGIKDKAPRSTLSYIKGKREPWWWEKYHAVQMTNVAGFFPVTDENLERFSELMLDDIKEIDLLGSWLKVETLVSGFLSNAKKVVLEDLEPFFTSNPWTAALAGRKVLVVHPFHQTIREQYANRHLIFPDGMLPSFDLKIIPAVQSAGGICPQFDSWFDALESTKSAMDQEDYEIAIIGAGAYGLPLAAHAKRQGRQAIHMGGVTQLLFGIIGRRWEENYVVWPYQNLFNEHWVRPKPEETPSSARNVENACYW